MLFTEIRGAYSSSKDMKLNREHFTQQNAHVEFYDWKYNRYKKTLKCLQLILYGLQKDPCRTLLE